MKFLPFLDLQVKHNYYTDGQCSDFWVEPTGATQKLLENQRCVLKTMPNGVRILIAVTEQNTEFIPLAKDVVFAFHLRLRNPDFALFTDLTELAQVGAPLYTNAELSPGQPGQLRLVSRQAWATEQFMVRQPAQADHFTLQGRPLPLLHLTDFNVEMAGATGKLSQYDEASKIITLDSRAAKTGDRISLRYPIQPQQTSHVFAEVEIHYNDSVPKIAQGPGAFQIVFHAKQARWKYYIITDKTTAQVQIDNKEAPSPVFSAKNRTDLQQQPDATDSMATLLAAQYPQLQRWRLVSDDLVACQQAARKAMQLSLDGNPVLGTLPNPSFQNYSTDSSNGNPQPVDSLFQVVKYFTH